MHQAWHLPEWCLDLPLWSPMGVGLRGQTTTLPAPFKRVYRLDSHRSLKWFAQWYWGMANLPQVAGHRDNIPRWLTTTLFLWQPCMNHHTLLQISWMPPSTTGKLLNSVLKFYSKMRMETGWGLNTKENYSPCLGGWEDFIWADDGNRRENKGKGKDQKDQEDIRRETVMCWCLWLGGKACTGGGGEENSRCWVKAALGQEAGSPKTSQNPSGVKGCP